MPIDKTQYTKGEFITGAPHVSDGVLIRDARRQPQRPPPAPDPRVVYLKAQAQALAALNERLARVTAQVTQVVERVRTRR